MIVVSVCLPCDALSQRLQSYLGFSSLLLQQSAAAASYLGHGVDPVSHRPRPWMWGSSSWLLLCCRSCTIELISHTGEVMIKILQARLQQYVNHELPDVQFGFRKGRGIRNQIANIRWIIEKAREFQKNTYFSLLTMPKPLTVWNTINCGKFWKR